MVLNRVNVLSAAELSVWKADTATEVPSDYSDSGSEAHSDTEFVHEQPTRNSIGLCRGAYCSRGELRPPTPLQQLRGDDPWFAAASRTGAVDESKLMAVFLDYDGTLREFEARPELAVPTPEIHTLLAALNRREDLLVHIISGRDAHFLSTHFGQYDHIMLIAEHERRVAGRFQVWRGPGGRHAATRDGCGDHSQDWRTLVRREFNQATATAAGSQVEEKAASLVWHYRGVADQAVGEAAATRLASNLEKLRRAQGLHLHVSMGRKTVEVSCRNVKKGDVMRRICARRAELGQPFKAVLVAGDDVSDESMFDIASDEFLTIKVGHDDTRAKYCVDSPEQLRSFLWGLVA